MITVKTHDSYLERASCLLKPYPLMTLFYLLPEGWVRELRLEAVPRCPLECVADDFFTTRYFGQAFSKRLMRLWARIMWMGGIRGFVGDYSEGDPMRILAGDPDICIKVLSCLGYDSDWLAAKSVTVMEIPYPGEEESVERFSRLIECFWTHPEIKTAEVYKIVRTHRAHGDYAPYSSNAKKDFIRSYDHTQSQYRTISFKSYAHEIVRTQLCELELENVDIHDGWEHFCKRLTGKHDETIFKMAYLGYKQKEIAGYVGYADQGAVSKRLKYILIEFQKQREIDKNPPHSNKPSTIKYEIIPFSYTRTTA